MKKPINHMQLMRAITLALLVMLFFAGLTATLVTFPITATTIIVVWVFIFLTISIYNSGE